MSELPKYLVLQEYLKKEIREQRLCPGDFIPSENELADKFNLSRHTVRTAISGLINEGLIISKKGKGSFVAPENGKMAGVIITYVSSYIFPKIICGINSVLSAKGHGIFLLSTNNRYDREKACLNMLKGKQLLGLIAEPTKSALETPNADEYKKINENNLPIVFINSAYKGIKGSVVMENDRHGGFIACNHLINRGHKKIGAIFKADDIQGHERYEGFSKALKENDIDLNKEDILWYTTEDAKEKLTDKYFEKLLKNTAVICYNDKVALMFIDYLKTKGISVPSDIAVVGFDNSELSTVTDIKLTTVQNNWQLLGEHAANILLSKKQNVKEVLMPELIERSST